MVPGMCPTELWDKQGHSKEAQEEVPTEFVEELSVGSVGSPEDVAEAYFFFTRANFANGTTVIIGKLLWFCVFFSSLVRLSIGTGQMACGTKQMESRISGPTER